MPPSILPMEYYSFATLQTGLHSRFSPLTRSTACRLRMSACHRAFARGRWNVTISPPEPPPEPSDLPLLVSHTVQDVSIARTVW